ncbi:vWA domain-containing protein, partial [Micromonospora sp. NPDC006766]|uniref:vWA domain-containing protein n=1 Tax=Micromonospora sp. NPDC006766 TaxID=3154778 RepID=UPI0033E39FC0
MSALWSGDRHRLVPVPGSGLISGERIGVPASALGGPSAGVLTLLSAGDRRLAVRLFPVPELPAGVVAIGADLVDEHGIDVGTVRWALREQPAAVPAQIVLEPMTDGSVQELARTLLAAPDLRSRVLLPEAAASVWITVGGTPFRVRGAADAAGRPIDGLVRIGAETHVLLYSQSGRTGVDIVILADCSGSMGLADVPQTGGEDAHSWRLGARSRSSTMERADAQRRALLHLLQARLGTSGRVSRIALVRFTTQCEVLFPREGGMAEMSADSEPAVGEAFQRAVLQLRPVDGNTDIGNALHYASELLHRHGVPGNDQLIVLVSDGADWNPKGDEATGETIAATTDPVSLMEELHGMADIRLHAIGISDEATFLRWWQAARGSTPYQPWMVPDHRLLTNLVRVGGGDPSRVGGLDVLEDYFAGLGAGVTTRIGPPGRESPLPPVQRDLGTHVRRAVGLDPAQREAFARTAEEARLLYAECLDAAADHDGLGVLRSPRSGGQFDELGAAAQSQAELKGWVAVAQGMFADRPGRLRPPVAEVVADARLRRLRQVHDDATAPIADNDVQGWFDLQRSLLQDLVGVLGDLRERLRAAVAAENAAT